MIVIMLENVLKRVRRECTGLSRVYSRSRGVCKTFVWKKNRKPQFRMCMTEMEVMRVRSLVRRSVVVADSNSVTSQACRVEDAMYYYI